MAKLVQTEARRKLVEEIQENFEECKQWYSTARNHFIDDVKFANADTYNNFQWPNDIRKSRDLDERPSLTINRTRQHNLQIINDAKKNTPGIKYLPSNSEASYESALVFSGIARHIQYQSKAKRVYDYATKCQVEGGVGYFRLITDYAADDTFEQEIYIRPVLDPNSVYLDPHAKELDKSDIRYAIIFDDIPRKRFKKLYPEWGEHAPADAIGESTWVTRDSIRICEYYYLDEEEDRLLHYVNSSGGVGIALASSLPKEVVEKLLEAPGTKSRKVKVPKVRKATIVGHEVARELEWPGKFIPVIPVLGEEVVIEGNYDCKGHTRALIDPQRMYNYWTSAGVEFGALQGKTPWIAPAGAIEGFEVYWNNANKQNYSVLVYNDYDDDGNRTIAPPARAEPPQMATLFLTGMQIAQQEMMLVSGQFQAQMGQPSNERSGKAIQERQRQGDTATYHYIDNLAMAIGALGRQLLDLIPKVYDSKRIVHILGEDQKVAPLEIDPTQRESLRTQRNEAGEIVRRVFNPAVGRYEVDADVGPGYMTQREEANNAFLQILTQAPQLGQFLVDLYFRNSDFPGADVAAERMERVIPPQALGKGPSQQEQALQGQLQKVQGILQKLSTENSMLKVQLAGKTEMRDVDAYEAVTKRLAALKDDLPMDAAGLRQVLHDLAHEAVQTNLHPLLAKLNLELGGQAPPVAGARRAPDGQWYVQDPNRQGSWMRVEQGAPQALANG